MVWLVARLVRRVRLPSSRGLVLIAALVTVAAGALFALTEHVSWFTGLYWAVVTVTTVGYGDVVPKNTAGRVVAIGTMVTVIPLVGAVFANWAAEATSVHFRRVLGMHTHSELTGHLVVLGYTPLIPHLLPDLLKSHEALVLVADVEANHLPEEPAMRFIAGDPANPHILAKANLARAGKIVIVGNTDGDVLMTAIEARHQAAEDSILAIAHSAKAVEALRALGVEGMATQDLVGAVIARSTDTPHAAAMLERLLTGEDTVLEEVLAEPDWVGRPLSEIRSLPGACVLGVFQEGTFDWGLSTDPRVTAKTVLIRLREVEGHPPAGTKTLEGNP